MTQTTLQTTLVTGDTAPVVPSPRANRRSNPTPAQDQQSEQSIQDAVNAELARRAALATEATDIVNAWTDSLTTAISLAKTVESRTAGVYAAFTGLGLIGEHKAGHAATLKASMLLCSPEKLAALASSTLDNAPLHLAIVNATITAWEHAVSMSAHATDKDAQGRGKALMGAMARSFYNASYAALQKSIEDARAAQRKANKDDNTKRQAARDARKATLEAARADASHQLHWLIDAYTSLDTVILAHAATDAERDTIREYVLDLVFASRVKPAIAPTPAPAPTTEPPTEPASMPETDTPAPAPDAAQDPASAS